MSIILELNRTPRSNHHIYSGNEKIYHTGSEDLLTANVFGLLQYLSPESWLRHFLEIPFSKEEHGILHCPDDFSKVQFSFWKKLDRPPQRRKEGTTEVDIFVEFKRTILSVECKFFSNISLNTKYFPHWDQIVRNVERGWIYTKRHTPQKEFYLLILAMEEDNTGLFQEYKLKPKKIKERFKEVVDKREMDLFSPSDFQKMSSHLGWAKWQDLLEVIRKENFGSAQKIGDLVCEYLRHKINQFNLRKLAHK